MPKSKSFKVDPSVRFGLLVSKELEKSDTVVPKADETFLKKLYEAKREIVEERDKIAKSFFLSLLGLYLLINNLSFEVPKTGVKLGDVPGMMEILIILSSFSFLIFTLKMRDEISQQSIINAYVRQSYGGRKIAHDIIKSSYKAESHYMNWMQFPYQIGVKDDLEYSISGKVFSSLILGLIAILLLLLLILPVTLIFYASYKYTAHNLLGKAVSGFSQISLLLGIVMLFIGIFNFKYKLTEHS